MRETIEDLLITQLMWIGSMCTITFLVWWALGDVDSGLSYPRFLVVGLVAGFMIGMLDHITRHPEYFGEDE